MARGHLLERVRVEERHPEPEREAVGLLALREDLKNSTGWGKASRMEHVDDRPRRNASHEVGERAPGERVDDP
jgi:hypothetical protein